MFGLLKKKQEVDLETILGQLHSEKARINAIERLVNRGNKVPEVYINEAIEYYKKIDFIKAAFEITREAGLTDRAEELLEEEVRKAEEVSDGRYSKELLGKAANLAERAGMFEKAVELYKRSNSPYGFISAAKKTKNPEKFAEEVKEAYKKIIEQLETQEEFFRAAEYAEKAGMLKKAVELYGKCSFVEEKVAKIAEQAGMTEKALEIFEEKCLYDDAARVARRAGMTAAADNYSALAELTKY